MKADFAFLQHPKNLPRQFLLPHFLFRWNLFFAGQTFRKFDFRTKSLFGKSEWSKRTRGCFAERIRSLLEPIRSILKIFMLIITGLVLSPRMCLKSSMQPHRCHQKNVGGLLESLVHFKVSRINVTCSKLITFTNCLMLSMVCVKMVSSSYHED